MTNADAPALTLKGIADTNPYTGNPIDMSGKNGGITVLHSFWSEHTDGNIFEPDDAIWYHVDEDFLNDSAWTVIGQP